MSARLVLFLFLGLDVVFLLLKTSDLSISYYEADLLYGEASALQYIVKFSLFVFGQNDFALRLPMVIMHLLSTLLLYKISKNYVDLDRNRVWLIIVFVLLPGVMSSALIVNDAGLVIFGLFLFIYVYQNFSQKLTYPLLASYLLFSNGFIYLFLSLSVFSSFKKDAKFFVLNMTLFFISLYMFGIDAHGTPKNYFIESMGIYAAIFSPIIFIYLVYVLYRKYLSKDLDMLFYIASTAFIISLVLSFRQKVELEIFAPYLLVALPIVAQTFERSYRVRLNMFRKNYKLIFTISLALLLLNSSVVFFNKYLYIFIEKPKRHFSYKLHVAKELAQKLKDRGITCVDSRAKMRDRLKFYGVTKCNKYVLDKIVDETRSDDFVTVSYKNRQVYFAHVTKLNIN